MQVMAEMGWGQWCGVRKAMAVAKRRRGDGSRAKMRPMVAKQGLSWDRANGGRAGTGPIVLEAGAGPRGFCQSRVVANSGGGWGEDKRSMAGPELDGGGRAEMG